MIMAAMCPLTWAAEPPTDDGALLAALAGVSRIYPTSYGWSATTDDGAAVTIYSTSYGYFISRTDRPDVIVTRISGGLSASNVGGTAGDKRAEQTSTGFRVSQASQRDTIMTKTRDGYSGSHAGGQTTQIRPSGSGYTVSGATAQKATVERGSLMRERAAALDRARRSRRK